MALLVSLTWLALGASVPLTGTVEDGAGRTVEGATVWLGDTHADGPKSGVLATATTDARGRFRLERAAGLAGRGGSWSPTLWALQPGSRLGFVEFKGNLPAADAPVRLVLGPPASAKLRVLRADGTPAAGARVRPVLLALKAPRPPDPVLDRLGATADADGRAAVDGLAADDLLWLDVTAPGQLVQCLPVDPEDRTVTLRPVGRLRVRVVTDDPKAARGWGIKASSRPTEPGYRGPYTTQWVHDTTDWDGRTELMTLAAGQVVWEVTPPDGSDDLVETPPSVTIRAGRDEEVEIAVRRGVRVAGVVREAPGGEPVAGVKVDLAPLKPGSRTVHYLVTDARGRFSGVVPPGAIRFNYSLHDLPKTHFLPPGTPHWADFEVKAGEGRHDFDPPRLRKAALVRGRVVDGAGRPVARAAVEGHWTSAEYGADPNGVRAETDAGGAFELGGIAPGAEVRVSATTGPAAASEPLTVASAGEGGPVTLRLQTRPTLALAGRVLGPDGFPLAGAAVRVLMRPPGQPMNPGGAFAMDGAEVRTGPDGCYRTTDRLPVGNEYRIEAGAEGFEPARSAWVASPETKVPDVALRRAVGRRTVHGRVVDTAGMPVAGAEVFQAGDGPKRTRGLTDGEGRFRVPGAPDAPALLFASKEGYHFLGRRVEAGDAPADFSLRRLDEPPPALLRPAAPAVPRAEERAIALALIAEARKDPGSVHDVPDRRRLPEILALVEPDRAIEMIENQVVGAEPGLLSALAVGRFEVDPGKALEVLDAVGSPEAAAVALLGVFDRLGSAAPPGFRRELLERAGRRARAIDAPGLAASSLARIADRWLDLGDTARGAVAVREAQGLAGKPRHEPFPDPRDDLALALARVDLPAALGLLEGRGEAQRFQLDALRAGIARRVAATDPAEARRLLGRIEESSRPSARRDAALAAATGDLAAARALAAEVPDPLLAALLPAVAARSRAGSDPVAARDLLRESVERLRGLEPAEGVASPAVVLARLVPLAARVDPDRAPDDFWLALSLRPPLSALPEPGPVLPQVRQQYLDRAELAVLSARYDRAAAEVVFAPVAARLVGLHDEYWGLGAEGPALYRVAGAFDARVARSLLDALPDDPPPPADRGTISAANFRHHSKAQARIALAESLALPPGLRLRGPLTPQAGDGWLRDLDD